MDHFDGGARRPQRIIETDDAIVLADDDPFKDTPKFTLHDGHTDKDTLKFTLDDKSTENDTLKFTLDNKYTDTEIKMDKQDAYNNTLQVSLEAKNKTIDSLQNKLRKMESQVFKLQRSASNTNTNSGTESVAFSYSPERVFHGGDSHQSPLAESDLVAPVERNNSSDSANSTDTEKLAGTGTNKDYIYFSQRNDEFVKEILAKNKEIYELNNRICTYESNIVLLKKELQKVQISNDALLKENNDYMLHINTIRPQLFEKERAYKDVEAENEKLCKEKISLKIQIDQKGKELTSYKQNVSSLEREIYSLKQEIINMEQNMSLLSKAESDNYGLNMKGDTNLEKKNMNLVLTMVKSLMTELQSTSQMVQKQSMTIKLLKGGVLAASADVDASDKDVKAKPHPHSIDMLSSVSNMRKPHLDYNAAKNDSSSSQLFRSRSITSSHNVNTAAQNMPSSPLAPNLRTMSSTYAPMGHDVVFENITSNIASPMSSAGIPTIDPVHSLSQMNSTSALYVQSPPVTSAPQKPLYEHFGSRSAPSVPSKTPRAPDVANQRYNSVMLPQRKPLVVNSDVSDEDMYGDSTLTVLPISSDDTSTMTPDFTHQIPEQHHVPSNDIQLPFIPSEMSMPFVQIPSAPIPTEQTDTYEWKPSGVDIADNVSSSYEMLVNHEIFDCPVCKHEQPQCKTFDEFQQHVMNCVPKDDVNNRVSVQDEEDRECPLCHAIFAASGSISEFEHHVNSHFDDN